MASEKLQRDHLAISIANALALANEAARARGIDPAQSLVAITEETTPTGPVRKINYGSRDYVDRRGGDLIVFEGVDGETVQRIVCGQ